MAVVTKTIGTGGDYATITAFEAAINNTTYPAAGTDVVGQIIEAKDWNENPVFNQTDTNITSITLTVASGIRHNGVEGGNAGQTTRARLRPTAGSSGITDIVGVNFTVEWLDIDGRGRGTSGFSAIEYEYTGSVGPHTFRYLLIHDFTATQGFIHAAIRSSNIIHTATIRVFNCVIYLYKDIGTTKTSAVGIDATGAAGATWEIANVTVWKVTSGQSGVGKGINRNTATVKVKNCVVAECSSSQFAGAFEATSNNNCSTDGTAPGASSLLNKTLAEVAFVSTAVGGEDLHIQTGSVLKDAGMDLSASGIADDIDAQARPQGAAYDIGADELLASGPTDSEQLNLLHHEPAEEWLLRSNRIEEAMVGA